VSAVTLDVRALLGGLIDHAALFPPASMGMADAVAEDRRVRAAPEGWLVGRFICPAPRLAELEAALGGWDGAPGLSAIVDPAALGRDLGLLGAARSARAPVELVEVKPVAGGELGAVAAPLRALGLPVWVETTAAGVPAVAAAGLGAKVRCGGERVPADAELAAFVAACRDAGIAFKATAGLHHPIRHEGGHGFLNLLAACAAARRGAGGAELARLLALRDPEAVLAAQDPAARELLSAYGSCSVREPVEDLRALGVL
jgi:hypothetical protein